MTPLRPQRIQGQSIQISIDFPLEINFVPNPLSAVTLDPKLKNAVLKKVATYVKIARNQLVPGLRMPTCSFDLDGYVAARAVYPAHHIQFNPLLLALYPDAFIKHVPGHEVAHIVTVIKFAPGIGARPAGLKAHGPQWKMVMRKLGVSHSDQTNRAIIQCRASRSKPKGFASLFGKRNRSALSILP